ncbi:MAG: amino acid-binding ACT domain-containing protein [Acidimicrobiia bacterium]|nr:amino acid-binding ACT domain-containing protein [Acidimicrobiia bacterium]
MYDVAIDMANHPGQLALMGRTLGEAGVSVEGGGMFLVGDVGVAHFLFEDGPAARTALEAVGFTVRDCREVVTVRLRQDEPGQLGKLTGLMAEAGVNIEVLYSDHDHRLILIVDDVAAASGVAAAWATPS